MRLPVAASPEVPQTNKATRAIIDWTEQRLEIQQRLARIVAQAEQHHGGAAEDFLIREAELLKWIDGIYSTYQTTSERYDELQQEANHIDEELQADA